MARIEYVPEVFDDFDRFFDPLARTSTGEAPARIADLLQAVDILAHSPLIGRPFRDGKRELVIGRGSHGCVALSTAMCLMSTPCSCSRFAVSESPASNMTHEGARAAIDPHPNFAT